jgi:uncharacterized membrane protein
MDTLYTPFKFLHILGAIVWIGGVIAVNIINVRVAREKEPSLLASLARQSSFFGAAVLGPAAGVTLLAGIVMIAVSGLGVPLWVIWGLAAIVVSIGLGATLIRRAGGALSEAATVAKPGDQRVPALQRRLATLNLVNVLVLLSAVWAMVFKPTL